jgi:lysophospholipase L1-like esterase
MFDLSLPRQSPSKPVKPISVRLIIALVLSWAHSGISLAVPPRNTAIIPVSKLENDSYDWNKRHEDILRIKADINPEIVLIGDSITHFWGGEPKSNHVNGPKAWDSVFGKSRVLNLGFGWDRTQNVLWRIDHGELDGIQPKLLIIHIGTNNTSQTKNARQNTAAEIAEGVGTISSRVRGKFPKAKIVLMAIFPREEKPDHPRRKLIGETNALLAKFPQAPDFAFVDIGPEILTPEGVLTKDMMPDFCHPSEKGYQIWAGALRPFVQSIQKP